MIVPKLKQRKDGNWTVKIPESKQIVNLCTKIYSVARERAKEAVYEGKRDFKDERFYDASSAPKTAAPPASAPGDWQSDVASAAASGPDTSGPSVDVGSEYFPPGEAPPSEDPPASAPKTPEGSTEIPPEMFDAMMIQAADVLVEAQIRCQEWLIARALKANAGPVPQANIGRTAAKNFWAQQLAKWMPKDVPLPEWAAAMIACAMFSIPVQLAGATPIEKPPTSAPNADYPTPG